MKNRFIRQGLVALVLASTVQLATAEAQDTLLAKTEALYQNNKITAELWGNKQQNGYADKLLLVLKRQDGTVLTGYKPSIQGGYGCTLKALQVKNKQAATEQLFLGIHQGDWRTYSEYRLLDITDVKAVQELFTAVDSFGVVVGASLEGNTLHIQTVKDKEPLAIELQENLLADISANRRQISFGKLQSLTCLDIDNDGLQELVTNQQILVDKRVLADVGAVWQYTGAQEQAPAAVVPTAAGKRAGVNPSKAQTQAEKTSSSGAVKKQTAEQSATAKVNEVMTALKDVWQELTIPSEQESAAASKELPQKMWKQENLTIMKSDVPNKRNTINNGAFFAGGMVYPVKMVAPNGEATYPQLMLNDNVELENTLNKLLWDESHSYIKSFMNGRADLAFNVLRADAKLLTIELISGKDSFVHHHINIVPGDKQKLTLAELLDMHKKQALVELLNVLNTNPKIHWDENLTEDWYLKDDTLYLMKNVAGNDMVSSFAMKNLKRYIKDKRFVEEAPQKADAKHEKTGAKDKQAAVKNKQK